MTDSEKSEQRAGLVSACRAFLREPMPQGVGWAHVLGSTLLFLIGLQLFTGVLLALTYSPSTQAAYESIRYLDNQMIFGNFIRALHHWTSSAVVIVLVLHMLRTFLYAAYKSPRRSTWVAGVVLLLLVLGFAFTGYLLPWDMKAYFATRVGLKVGATAPLFGPAVAKLLQGGNELGDLTLTRFYALHVVVLPIILLFGIGIHLHYVRLHKITPPWKRNDEPAKHGRAFFPTQLARDQIAVTVVLFIVAAVALKFGAPLEAKADPTDTSYVPRPEWYFYGLYQLLRIFQGPFEIVGTVILPTIFFLALFALPFLDRSPERAVGKRRLILVSGLCTFLAILLLTVWGGFQGAHEAAAARAKVTDMPGPDVEIADAAVGQELFTQLRCASCHAGPSQGVNIPPGLEFSGSKFEASWLATYLVDPFRIRWREANVRAVERMPDFDLTKQEARDLAAFLMQKTDVERIPAAGIDWSASDTTAIASGRQLVGQYACAGCHVIEGEGTNLGPTLDHVGSKLKPNYIYRLILNPKQVIPGTPMKNNQLWEDEAEAITRYLDSLK